MATRRNLVEGLSVLAALAFLGCSGAGGGASALRPSGVGVSAKPKGSDAEVRALIPAKRFAQVPSGTFGPYLGTRPGASVVVWAQRSEGVERRFWIADTLDAAGKAAMNPSVIGPAAAEVDLVAVRPLGEGDAAGFLVLTSSREFSGARVDAIATTVAGEAAGPPAPLVQSLQTVTWLDVVPTRGGALAMWAVKRLNRADLFAVEVGTNGASKGPVQPVLDGVTAWQVAAWNGGAAVGGVTAGNAKGEPGSVKLVFTDAQGRVQSRVPVSESPTAEADLDLVAVGGSLVLAWSDTRAMEPRVYSAAVDGAGKLLRAPAPVTPAFGPQALLRLVPPATSDGPAFVAWENSIERAERGRIIRLAPLSKDGTLGSIATLDIAATDGSVPELVATPGGLAALTVARACRKGGDCLEDSAVPTYVEFDAALSVIASEPLLLDALDGNVADLAWGLHCGPSGCMGLAAATLDPAPIFSLGLRRISDGWLPVARQSGVSPPPRVATIEAIGKSAEVADVAAARTGTSTLVAWLTAFDPSTPFKRSKTPAPDGKFEPVRSVLRLRPLPDEGAAPEPVVISYRAHSLGGVALSPGDPAKKETLVAWVGIDAGEPQVFLTLVAPDGKKISQKMLTQAKGRASDVALAYVGDAWVVAWVDERTGTPQVYLAKVDRALKPVVAERRLGTAASVQTGVQLLARGEHVVVAWSDARGPVPGAADVYVARVSATDLAPVGPEHPAIETSLHSRSPTLAPLGDGAALLFIEDARSAGGGAPSKLQLIQLDSGAETVPAASRTVDLGGSVESAGLACGTGGCRIVATVARDGEGGVEAFVWRRGAEITPKRLVALGTAARRSVGVAVGVDGSVYYADDLRPSEARVRKLGVTWE